MTLQTQGLARWTLLEGQSGIYHLPNIGIRTRLHLTQIQRGKGPPAILPYCLQDPLYLKLSWTTVGQGRREGQQQQRGLQGSGAGASKQHPEKRPRSRFWLHSKSLHTKYTMWGWGWTVTPHFEQS